MKNEEKIKLEQLQKMTQPLLDWYRGHARPLPWRERPEAYRVWISEIMLQQTRIEAVKPYYDRFLAQFPNVEALASAPEEAVLKCWEGLGYYSRARNLQKAACVCMESYAGQLPASYEALRELPGIGNYTAGAIASIAYGLAAPAVDGNVLRVLSRLFSDARDITKQAVRRETEQLLRQVIPPEAPGAFNEAVMEIGETICIPNGAPLCEACPLAKFCAAKKEGRPEAYPVKAPKKPRRIEKKTILLLLWDGCVALRRRPAKGLLAGMYEFPSLEGQVSPEKLPLCLPGLSLAKKVESLGEAKHIFSHVEWHMSGYLLRLNAPCEGDWEYVPVSELKKTYPLPNAFRAYSRFLFDENGR